MAHIRLGYFNLLVHMPEDYDEIFQCVIKLNAQIRDWPYGEAYGKVYSGMGVYRLTNQPEDFFTAQYNADICRVESPESVLRNSHFEVYGTWAATTWSRISGLPWTTRILSSICSPRWI